MPVSLISYSVLARMYEVYRLKSSFLSRMLANSTNNAGMISIKQVEAIKIGFARRKQPEQSSHAGGISYLRRIFYAGDEMLVECI